jgi:hypothetical protein
MKMTSISSAVVAAAAAAALSSVLPSRDERS